MTQAYHGTSKTGKDFSLPNNLTVEDVAMLAGKSIPLHIAAGYVRRVSDEEAAALIGQTRRAGRELSGLLFGVYTGPGADHPTEYELRRDVPDIELKNGIPKETGKYLRPPGRGNLLAIPKDVTADELNDISIPILICEGMKKLLAAIYLST